MTIRELEVIENVKDINSEIFGYNSFPLELRRVKLYEVNPDNGNWIDCGTGYLSILKENNDFHIVVDSDSCSIFDETSELKLFDNDSKNKLLEDNIRTKIVDTPIKMNREYCHQKESIITWQDGNNSDLYRALSFQHSESCNSVWGLIFAIVPYLCVDLLEYDDSETQSNLLVLERPTKSNIDTIVNRLEVESNLMNSENVVIDILQHGFLDDLFNLMEELEVKGDINSLHKIFQVIRRIVVFYSHFNEIFETILSDEYYLRFFKACEYDETLENYKAKLPHRKFLENVKFHSVVPLPEVHKIHLNYRLMYLRDVVMPRYLDEQTLQRICALINGNFSSIINMIVTTGDIWRYLKDNIQKDFLAAKFIHAVLTVLKQNPMSIYERHQIFMNLKANHILCEFSGYLKENCIGARQMLELIDNNLNKENISDYSNFDITNINYTCIKPIDLAVEVFSMVCDINPGLLRHAIQESTSENINIEKNQLNLTSGNETQKKQQRSKRMESIGDVRSIPSLWLDLCDIFVSSSESTQIQISSIFKRILDPKTMDFPERDDSLSLFYDMGVLDRLIDYLLSHFEDNNIMNPIYSARVLFCDILSTCVQEHNYRIKYKILQNQLPYRLLQIATYPFHKIFFISVVKFLKTCLGTRDDFYYRLFAKHDIFKEIFLVLFKLKVPRSRGEGCILESVILEMLEFICRNKIQVLLKYIMEKYSNSIHLLNNYSLMGSRCKVFARIIDSFINMPQSHQKVLSCENDQLVENITNDTENEVSYFTHNTNNGAKKDELFIGENYFPGLSYSNEDSHEISRGGKKKKTNLDMNINEGDLCMTSNNISVFNTFEDVNATKFTNDMRGNNSSCFRKKKSELKIKLRD
ncbi:hypothetical protein FG386_003532 [Cryptosporidium ryanae]|uniref:uncharacterized protein n=1 Tax=Cryptosporidium ryanae TaxID=515981 RepID=UPI00351A4B55|nr:hypothetical protein FG386_003532 [Cryptosporidium ryanae]